jgi:hypothetical protein
MLPKIIIIKADRNEVHKMAKKNALPGKKRKGKAMDAF